MSENILLVDDHVELLAVLRQSLRLNGDFRVVAEATDGVGAILAARIHQPDIVILDLGLPDLAGHEVLTGIRDAAPAAQIVIFSGAHTSDREFVAVRAEAFVGKEQPVDELVNQLIDLGRTRHLSARLQVASDPSGVATARHFIDALCEDWDCMGFLPDAQLVVSELVTNALVHAHSGCVVHVALTTHGLRIEVTDHGHGGMPALREPTIDDIHGRGLLIVGVLSLAWGIESIRGNGNLIWSVLPAVA